jgi:hypothetical protein
MGYTSRGDLDGDVRKDYLPEKQNRQGGPSEGPQSSPAHSLLVWG